MVASFISAAALILAALVGSFFARRYADFCEARALKAALAAELRALLAIIDRRRYVEVLTTFVQSLPEIYDGRPLQPFSVRVAGDYQRIFSAVTHKLGLLAPELAEGIVIVHYHIQAALEDFRLSSTATTDPGAY